MEPGRVTGSEQQRSLSLGLVWYRVVLGGTGWRWVVPGDTAGRGREVPLGRGRRCVMEGRGEREARVPGVCSFTTFHPNGD